LGANSEKHIRPIWIRSLQAYFYHHGVRGEEPWCAKGGIMVSEGRNHGARGEEPWCARGGTMVREGRNHGAWGEEPWCTRGGTKFEIIISNLFSILFRTVNWPFSNILFQWKVIVRRGHVGHGPVAGGRFYFLPFTTPSTWSQGSIREMGQTFP
jgi:hypothetical protein